MQPAVVIPFSQQCFPETRTGRHSARPAVQAIDTRRASGFCSFVYERVGFFFFLPGEKTRGALHATEQGNRQRLKAGAGGVGVRWSEVTDAEKSADVQVVLLLLASPSTVRVT